MSKVELSVAPWMYPMPVAVVGTVVDGTINYNTIAYCGVIGHRPPLLYVCMSKHHHTTRGIQQSSAFSVNIPSSELIDKVDYAGVVSGESCDKSQLFKSFIGVTGTPLAKECAVNFDCRLEKTLDFGGGELVFIGKIEKLYAEESVLTGGRLDVQKITPLCLDNARNTYYGVGKDLAPAYRVGCKELNR